MDKKNKSVFLILALFAIMLMALSCTNDVARAEFPVDDNDSQAVKDTATKTAVRIVFVDKENCCKCTGQRTEKSWSALQGALKNKTGKVPVERIHIDTQADKAAKYKAMKPIMVIPAIYFLDADNGLIEMLQGEVTREQVEKFL